MTTRPSIGLLATTLACFTLAALTPAHAQDVTITNARIIGPNAAVIERGSIVMRGCSSRCTP